MKKTVKKTAEQKEVMVEEYEKSKRSYFEIWRKMMEIKEMRERVHLCGI